MMKKLTACAVGLLGLAGAHVAQAATLNSAAGLSNTVSFSGAFPRGTLVTSQFSAEGVVLGGTGQLFVGSSAYSSNPGFSGNYLDNYSGVSSSSVPGGAAYYSIGFLTDVQAAGAYFEFNAGSSAAVIAAYDNGALVTSFVYSNASCCTSSEFLGFTGFSFDELRVSSVGGNGALLMDSVSFSAAVPEPAGMALAAAGIAVVMSVAARRRGRVNGR
jgi:hypothetical protein